MLDLLCLICMTGAARFRSYKNLKYPNYTRSQKLCLQSCNASNANEGGKSLSIFGQTKWTVFGKFVFLNVRAAVRYKLHPEIFIISFICRWSCQRPKFSNAHPDAHPTACTRDPTLCIEIATHLANKLFSFEYARHASSRCPSRSHTRWVAGVPTISNDQECGKKGHLSTRAHMLNRLNKTSACSHLHWNHLANLSEYESLSSTPDEFMQYQIISCDM